MCRGVDGRRVRGGPGRGGRRVRSPQIWPGGRGAVTARAWFRAWAIHPLSPAGTLPAAYWEMVMAVGQGGGRPPTLTVPPHTCLLLRFSAGRSSQPYSGPVHRNTELISVFSLRHAEVSGFDVVTPEGRSVALEREVHEVSTTMEGRKDWKLYGIRNWIGPSCETQRGKV